MNHLNNDKNNLAPYKVLRKDHLKISHYGLLDEAFIEIGGY
jgi:hypothetical protein